MMTALLHSTGSRIQTGMETQRKDVKNPLYSRRLLMMMIKAKPSATYFSLAPYFTMVQQDYIAYVL